MPPEEIDFQTFFASKLKERGVTLKKLAEATGIAPSHLENMVHGKFDDLPSAPYVRGYLVRLGKALDFDGEVWWEKLKKEGLIQNSGPADALPNNRFLKKSPAKFVWAGVVALLVIIYLIFQLPIIFSKPSVKISFPAENSFTTASSTLTIQGTARNADSLSLNGDTIMVATDGSWQKTVLLQDGLNTFTIVAKKLLGGETDVTEQVLYRGVASVATGTTATSSDNQGSTTPITATTTP